MMNYIDFINFLKCLNNFYFIGYRGFLFEYCIYFIINEMYYVLEFRVILILLLNNFKLIFFIYKVCIFFLYY